MQLQHAPIKYVHSKVTLYYSVLVDQKWKRSIHSCALCDLKLLRQTGQQCSAIHHGYCTAVVAVPAAMIAKVGKGAKPKITVLRRITNKPNREIKVIVLVKKCVLECHCFWHSIALSKTGFVHYFNP